MSTSGGSSGGSSAVLTATAHLTGAEIATLFSSPTTIVAAPGAGKALVPVSLLGEFHPDAGVWVVAFSGLYWGGGNPGSTREAFTSLSEALGGDGATLVSQTQLAGPAGRLVPRANMTNRALVVAAGPADPSPASTIATKTIAFPGSGYAPGDAGTIDGPVYLGAGKATYVVDTVDGGGGVLTATITNHGAGYQQGQDYGCSKTSGGGDDGLGFNVTTVADPGGDLYLTVLYMIVDTHT